MATKPLTPREAGKALALARYALSTEYLSTPVLPTWQAEDPVRRRGWLRSGARLEKALRRLGFAVVAVKKGKKRG